jgi:inner membrane protein YidH
LNDEFVDATRRTRLARERTELAWWRAGLTALAVAFGVGRVVPGLEGTATRWPYAAVGVCFALYGIAVIVYGTTRNRKLEEDLSEGRFSPPPRLAYDALAGAGVVLGVLTPILILFD